MKIRSQINHVDVTLHDEALNSVAQPFVRTVAVPYLPATIEIVGISANPEDRKLILRSLLLDHERLISLSVEDLANGEAKGLASLFVEHGQFELLERNTLKKVSLDLLKAAASNIVPALSSTGYQKPGAYVWNGKAYWFCTPPKTTYLVLSQEEGHTHTSTLRDWQCHIGEKLAGNPYLVVIHAHALAAALLRVFNRPSLALILVGPSGVGKTTAQHCAQSMIGPPNEVRTMSGTQVGIREHLLGMPDLPAFFQDTRQFPVDDLIDLIFDVADGAVRLKSGSNKTQIASTLILSNERHLSEMSRSMKQGLDEGIYARSFELQCSGEYGMFHHLHGENSAAEFAKRLDADAYKYFGTVWTSWIATLSENWPVVLSKHEKWAALVQSKIEKKIAKTALSRVNNRIFDSLAFSAWVGVLASHFGILPVTRNEIVDSFALVLNEFLSAQKSGMSPIAGQLIDELKGFLDENSGKFPAIELLKVGRIAGTSHGCQLPSKTHGTLYLFRPQVFKQLFADKYGNVAYKLLVDAGYLVTNAGRGNQYLARIPGTKERRSFVAIKASICAD